MKPENKISLEKAFSYACDTVGNNFWFFVKIQLLFLVTMILPFTPLFLSAYMHYAAPVLGMVSLFFIGKAYLVLAPLTMPLTFLWGMSFIFYPQQFLLKVYEKGCAEAKFKDGWSFLAIKTLIKLMSLTAVFIMLVALGGIAGKFHRPSGELLISAILYIMWRSTILYMVFCAVLERQSIILMFKRIFSHRYTTIIKIFLCGAVANIIQGIGYISLVIIPIVLFKTWYFLPLALPLLGITFIALPIAGLIKIHIYKQLERKINHEEALVENKQ